MQEYITDAVVLDVSPRGEYDREIALYTRILGRVDAFARGSRRPTSKFSPHLDIINLVSVRLVEKNRVTVVDVLTRDRFQNIRRDPSLYSRALSLLRLVYSLAPRFTEESEVWERLVAALSAGTVDPRPLLALFGYDVRHAACAACGAKDSDFFSPRDHVFFCSRCGSQFPRNELICVV